jgi:Na+-driven multidrug efflux pump
MYTATTNLVAASYESDQTEAGKPRSTNTLIGALQLSSFVGVSLGLVLLVFSKILLRAIIGNDNINPAVFASAVKYVRIRALGMPAAAIIGSAQAGCLGMQDIKSPLYVLAAAAVINFLGDLIFVGMPHPWIGGAAGAAWATVFSQYAAVLFFLRWLCKKPNVTASNQPMGWSILRVVPLNWREKMLDGKSRPTPFRRLRHTILSSSKKIVGDKDNPQTKAKTHSSRGCLEGRFQLNDLIKFPQRTTTNDFAPYVLPVTTTQVGRVSSYVAMSHVVSSTLGTTSMAAQQVILSLFYCLCPIADSLNLTAQSFVPAIFGKGPSKQRAQALRQTTLNFVKAGALFGAIMAAAVSCVPWFSRLFTADPDVVSLVNMVAPYLVGVFSVHGVVCATEGLLLGQKDLGFLGKMYASYFVAVPFLMMRLKKAALLGAQLDLTSVWKVFLGYQWFRFGAWLLRVAMLQRRAFLKADKE